MGNAIGLILLSMVVIAIMFYVVRRVWGDAAKEWSFVYRQED